MHIGVITLCNAQGRKLRYREIKGLIWGLSNVAPEPGCLTTTPCNLACLWDGQYSIRNQKLGFPIVEPIWRHITGHQPQGQLQPEQKLWSSTGLLGLNSKSDKTSCAGALRCSVLSDSLRPCGSAPLSWGFQARMLWEASLLQDRPHPGIWSTFFVSRTGKRIPLPLNHQGEPVRITHYGPCGSLCCHSKMRTQATPSKDGFVA